MTDELPEGWTEALLGDLLREPLRNGHSAKASSDGSGVRTLTLTAVTYGNFCDENTKITVADPSKISDLWLEPGDLLIERANTPELVGTVRLYRGAKRWAIFPDLVIRARVGSALVPEYVELVLQSRAIRKYFTEAAQGTAGSMPKIDQGTVENVSLRIAPLWEQRRIVTQVESLLEQVNLARGRLERVPDILKQFRQAVLAAACLGELTCDDAERCVEGPYDFLPNLPDGWRWLAARDACKRLVDCHNKTAPYSDTGIRLLRTTNIRNGELALDDARYVTEETYKFWSRRCPPQPGDVLFTREAPMGEAAMVPPGMKVCMGQRMMLLRANDEIISREYLLLAVQSPYVRKYAEQVAVGSGVLHMRVGDVERLPLPVPPRHMQDEIVHRVRGALSLMARLERHVLVATSRANQLSQAILSKAFSGELVPTEAELARIEGRTYETAEELLARAREHQSGTEPKRRMRGNKAERSKSDGAYGPP